MIVDEIPDLESGMTYEEAIPIIVKHYLNAEFKKHFEKYLITSFGATESEIKEMLKEKYPEKFI